MLSSTVLAAARRHLIGVPVVLAVVACTGAPTQSSPSTSSAGPDPTTVVTPVPFPTQLARKPAPQLTWGDWVADVAPIVGLPGAGNRIQLSFSWERGDEVWIQTESGDLVLRSNAVAVADGDFGIQAIDSAGECPIGDVGAYRAERSDDGLFLDVRVVHEPCTVRAAALERTWVRSLGAVNDGGPGIIGFGSFDILAALPRMRFAMSDEGIHTFEENDPTLALIVIMDPRGLDAPCAAERTALPIDGTPEAIVEYLGGIPGLKLRTEKTSVDGHQAIHATIGWKEDPGCTADEVAVFRRSDGAGDVEWTVERDVPQSFWIVQVENEVLLLWWAGANGIPSDESAVIGSIRLLDTLPTP